MKKERKNMTKSIFEENGGTYIKCGDYYVPDFGQFNKQAVVDERPLGKYGSLRHEYLKQHRKAIYNSLIITCKLGSHLRDVQEQAQNRLDTLIPLYKEKYEVTEELKRTNQMLWVQEMNQIVAQIEELVFSELVYT